MNQHLAFIAVLLCATQAVQADERLEFFEKKIRPALIQHCYSCHSEESKDLAGGLRLDVRAGWELGGESGSPAVVPGKPDDSLLLKSVRHLEDVSAMPPKQPRLPDSVIADFEQWIKDGAVDPRDGSVVRPDKAVEWEQEYQRRLDWWSLKPVARPTPPMDQSNGWVRNDVDRFIAAKLSESHLQPQSEASRATLLRRLSFALRGLPPSKELLDASIADESPQSYDALVDRLLSDPHFGERWARHWMDVVHYSDTHGYEWDVPAKNAWRYRDYLIRAFNADVPYKELVQEQLAGDLLPPRINQQSGINEALIGPMMLRLGERRHGDNSAIEGVTQEAVANMIDTLGKAFLGTTLACAQCHDHKLDAIEQKDYYSLAGMLMSTRFPARPVDVVDRNAEFIKQLRTIKSELRTAIARRWGQATSPQPSGSTYELITAITSGETPSAAFPSTIVEFQKRSLSTPISKEEFTIEHQRRTAENAKNLTLWADLSKDESTQGWRWEGAGMQHGLASDGEYVVADEGDTAIFHVLPAGRYSHLWSSRLAGSLYSPELNVTKPITFSFEAVSGKFASQSFIVDRAINPERMQFPSRPMPQWQAVTAGNFDSLEGTIDRAPRRVYFELATKSLNNYFPPRVGYGGVSEAEIADERCWFGVSRIYQHAPEHPPQDDLSRFSPLFHELAAEPNWAARLTALLNGAVHRWERGECNDDDVRLLNDALHSKLLPIDLTGDPEVARLVQAYRAKEKEIVPDTTVGSVAESHDGRDERIAIRGSYTEHGDAVARAGVRVLTSFHGQLEQLSHDSSGRLLWAQQITGDANPLLARVYVNRIWYQLFGSGLVRSTDDFGHLGELPSHPELLDHLASEFVRHDWSTKWLVRELVTSATWRQGSVPTPTCVEADPENRLWHHMPMRRLEAEAIRDSLLAVSGRLDATLFGPPIEPYRTAEDSQKRLFKGPLDGLGRRSIYLEMTLMEPPRFLATFNQPIPKQTVGRRDVTNTPDQALTMLNDPFVIEMARHWSNHVLRDAAQSPEERVAQMIELAFSRPARGDEVASLRSFAIRSAELHGVTGDVMMQQVVWQDVAHAIFNLKEFIYVP